GAAAAARHGCPGELHLARPDGEAAAPDRSRPAQAERSRLRRGVCTAGDRIARRRAQARSPHCRRPGHAAAAGGIRLSQVVWRQSESDPGAARNARGRYRRQDAKMTGERQMMKSLIAISLALGAAAASAQQTVNMPIVIELSGAEAAEITQAGNPYIFRTSFGQQMSMPKIANYLRDGLKAKTVALLWVNNDFGKGGRDTFVKEMAARSIKVVSDVSTESGQMDF